MSRHARPSLLRRVNVWATSSGALRTTVGIGATLGLLVPPTVAWALSTAPQPGPHRIDAIPVQTTAPATAPPARPPGTLAPVFDPQVQHIDPAAEPSGYARQEAAGVATQTAPIGDVGTGAPAPSSSPQSPSQPAPDPVLPPAVVSPQPPAVEPTVPTPEPEPAPSPETPTPEPPADSPDMVDDLLVIVGPPSTEETP